MSLWILNITYTSSKKKKKKIMLVLCYSICKAKNVWFKSKPHSPEGQKSKIMTKAGPCSVWDSG